MLLSNSKFKFDKDSKIRITFLIETGELKADKFKGLNSSRK